MNRSESNSSQRNPRSVIVLYKDAASVVFPDPGNPVNQIVTDIIRYLFKSEPQVRSLAASGCREEGSKSAKSCNA
jgi:hypothetical protein